MTGSHPLRKTWFSIATMVLLLMMSGLAAASPEHGPLRYDVVAPPWIVFQNYAAGCFFQRNEIPQVCEASTTTTEDGQTTGSFSVGPVLYNSNQFAAGHGGFRTQHIPVDRAKTIHYEFVLRIDELNWTASSSRTSVQASTTSSILIIAVPTCGQMICGAEGRLQVPLQSASSADPSSAYSLGKGTHTFTLKTRLDPEADRVEVYAHIFAEVETVDACPPPGTVEMPCVPAEARAFLELDATFSRVTAIYR